MLEWIEYLPFFIFCWFILGYIIDEIFLVQAQENDELGKNIEKMDLEQVRYFNAGIYDMPKLLGIESEMISASYDGQWNYTFYPYTNT